jgi:hypothetical protein
MKFKELAEGAEFVIPTDIISKGKVIFKKIKGRHGVWSNLALDEKGMENVISPEAEVVLIESGK